MDSYRGVAALAMSVHFQVDGYKLGDGHSFTDKSPISGYIETTFLP